MDEERQKFTVEEIKNHKLAEDLKKAINEKNEAVAAKAELCKKVTELEGQLKAQKISTEDMLKMKSEYDDMKTRYDRSRRMVINELIRIRNQNYELEPDT